MSIAVITPAHTQPIDFISPAQEADWTLIETLAKKKGAYDACFVVVAKDNTDPMLAAIGKTAAHIGALTESYIRKYAVSGATVQRPSLFGYVTWSRVFESVADGNKERQRLGTAECGVVHDDAIDRASRWKD